MSYAKLRVECPKCKKELKIIKLQQFTLKDREHYGLTCNLCKADFIMSVKMQLVQKPKIRS
jgi:transposase-like protein